MTVKAIQSVGIFQGPLSVCCLRRTEVSVTMVLTRAALTPTALTGKMATHAVVGLDSQEMDTLAQVCYQFTTTTIHTLLQ